MTAKCERAACSNDVRYTSGLCGVCDVLYNRGRGVLLSKRQREMIRLAAERFPAWRHFLRS